MPVLLLLLLLASPAVLRAQGVPLVLDAGTRVKTVEVERSRGNAVFNLETLAPLGATVTKDARGATLKIFGSTITFDRGRSNHSRRPPRIVKRTSSVAASNCARAAGSSSSARSVCSSLRD